VQLSIDATKGLDYHLNLGAALAPLREQGILIVGSGNVVHNLGRLDHQQPDSGYPWATDFNQAATALMSDRPGDITKLVEHRHYNLAAPTPEHLLPLFYVAGLAAAAESGTEVLIDGYTKGSLSMTTHVLNRR